MIVWFTGQPGSGKTTLARALQRQLQKTTWVECEDKVVNIDGDGLRDIFDNKDYSEAGRLKNIALAISVARWLDANGFFVIVSLVSPYRWQREELKATNDVLECYVHTTEIRGREGYFADGYEPPEGVFLDLETTTRSIDSCIVDIMFLLLQKHESEL